MVHINLLHYPNFTLKPRNINENNGRKHAHKQQKDEGRIPENPKSIPRQSQDFWYSPISGYILFRQV